jgi:hypothetical protein
MSARDMAAFARHLEQMRQRKEDERTARYAAIRLVGAMAPREAASASISDKGAMGGHQHAVLTPYTVAVQVRGPSGYLHQCEPPTESADWTCGACKAGRVAPHLGDQCNCGALVVNVQRSETSGE